MNDMLLNMLANDSFTVSDFKAVGLSADNTKLESEERYKQSQMIQDNHLFKDDEGNFNDELFHQYYLEATDFYNKLADDTYIENITQNTFYSKDNIFAPEGSKTIDETPRFVVSSNPFLQNNSLTRVGKKGDRTLSISEIAQKQKVFNTKSNTFEDESVNDRAFGNNPFKWLGDLFSEPLVIAQWDEDGEHVDLLTGEKKTHKKGDYKYNSDGTFYYETLNGRDVYGRQVLNRMNTLTVDGSKANKYDFFDSDDLEQKSVIGTVMKNLALVGSMFLPVVGKPIIAASIATQSAGLLGALGKMFLGSENKTANNLHAWAKTVNRQNVSEYASQNTWCWENMLNMIGDTVGQLAEQRFLFTHVPALFKGTKGVKARDTKTYQQLLKEGEAEIREKTTKDLQKAITSIKATPGTTVQQQVDELTKQWATAATLKSQAALEKYMQSYNQLGSIMSKAYMTGITVQDTYGEAKANGASDMEALALTLGYAAGEAWILNTGLGEWIMPELQGDKLKYRAVINALQKEVKPLTQDAAETATKEGRQNLFKRIFNIGKRIATDDYARQQFASSTYNPMQVVLAHAAGEGFEEVSEELLADVSKSAFNVVNWLRGDDTRIAEAWENIGDRYGMSLLGGFIGGGISSAGTDFSYARQLGKMTNQSAIQEIVYMINNDKIDDFLKFANKADLGNKYLSTDVDENGNNKPGTKDNNQDREIKQMLNNQVQLIKDVINAEGAKFSENSLFDALTLKDLRYLQLRDTTTASLYFQEYNSLVSQIVAKSKEIRDLSSAATDSNNDEAQAANAGKIAQAKKELNDLRVRKDAIVSGKRAPEFIQTALYEASMVLHAHNRGYIFQKWAEKQTNKKFEELTETEIKQLKETYKAYRDTEMKNDVLGDARQFVDLVGLASGAILAQSDYLDRMLKEGRENALLVQTHYGNMLDGIKSMLTDPNLDTDTFLQKTQNRLLESLSKTSEQLASPLFSQETLNRLNHIASTPVDELYTEDLKRIDYMSTVLESFADYADTITNQFIDKGYIHPEVRNHLINSIQNAIESLEAIASDEDSMAVGNNGGLKALARLSAYLGKTEDEVYESALSSERTSLFEGYIENLENKIKQLKQLQSTPIIDLLESFKVATSTTDTSVRDVLEVVNNLINQSYSDITGFSFGADLAKQLDEVDELVDFVASALYATRVDKAGVGNAWGYSKTLNELNRKYGNDQWVELAEIDGQKAELLQQDLALIKQKIEFAKKLNGINSGQKLTQQTKVGYNKQYIFYNKLKRFVDIVQKELPDWRLDSITEAMSQIDILDKYNHIERNKRRFSLTPEEKIKIEKESLLLEDAVYQFFNDPHNAAKVSNVDELAKLVNGDNFNLFDPVKSLLTDTVEDLDDNQFIFSLAARAAIKSSDFYNALRKTFNDQKAPIPMQEQATYLNVAMVLNGNVINNFAKAYAKGILNSFNKWDKNTRIAKLRQLGYSEQQVSYYSENPEAFQSDHAVEKFANIILTEGIAGSGKTEGVFDSTVRVIEQINPDLLKDAFVVNATLANAEALQQKLRLSGKVFSSSHAESEHDLVNYFYADFTRDYNDKVKIVNNQIVHSFKLKEDLKDLPKIIFIDEASRYDYVQMKLISEAAQHYGIAVLAAGDFDQISAESRIKDKDGNTYNLSPHRLNFIRSPKLGLSFRTLNSQMTSNQTEVQAKVYDDKDSRFTISYWEDEQDLRGFKVYENTEFDDIVKSIEKIKKLLKPDEKIGFLYADEEQSLYKKVKEKYGDLIDGKSITDAQGLEGNYYIIDFNQKSVDETKKSWLRLNQEFYTAFTRAKVGGIIINNKKNQPIIIDNIMHDASELHSITPQAIINSSRKRAEIFNKIFENEPEEALTYIPLTPVKKEAWAEPSEETDEGIEPELPEVESKPLPPGTFLSKEEAEKVDLFAYQAGFELLDKDDQLFGTVVSTGVKEHKEADGSTYYAPVVTIKNTTGDTVDIYSENLLQYKLQDPSTKTQVAKYKVGNIFYDSEGKTLEVIQVDNTSDITYKLKKEDGSTIDLKELELATYSTIPPVNPSHIDEDADLGENDDSETYKQKRENANGSTFTQRLDSDGKIQHWMYTFNAYETGVLWDDQGKIRREHFDLSTPIGQRTKERIDNVNGLYNMGAVSQTITKAQCLDLLAQIHSQLMYNTDNGSILQNISDILNIPIGLLSSIEYGIKSSAGISSKNPNQIYGNKDGHTIKLNNDGSETVSAAIFDKHRDEKAEYSHPSVVSGDAISRKDIVAVFRNKDGKKVLEITLGVLNSPLTLGQMTNDNGEYVYPEIGALLEKLTPESTGEDVFNVCTKAIEICNDKQYTDLGQLFKAFLFTGNGFAPLHASSESFNLASQFNYGPNIIKQKGDYQRDGKRQYETQYVDLDEFVKDPRVVVSEVFIPKTNVYGGHTYSRIHPGHAGVFVTYNKSHDKATLADKYLEQQKDPNAVKDIEFYYVIPPEATVEEYLVNSRHIYLNELGEGPLPTTYIGNMWTSYNLLKNLHKNKALLKYGADGKVELDAQGYMQSTIFSPVLNDVELSDLIQHLEALMALEEKTDWESDEKYKQLFTKYKTLYANEQLAKKYAIRNARLIRQKEILTQPFNASINSKRNQMKVYKVFTSFIANAAYSDKSPATKPNMDVIRLIAQYNKGTIKYKPRYAKGNPNSMFIKAATSSPGAYTLKAINTDGTIVNKAFQINAKIDPPVFEFEALKHAVAILAQWEDATTADGKPYKKVVGDFRNGFYKYLRNSKTKPKTLNNFELLKENNKMLFETGLFKDITVDGANDPAYDQLHFAEEVLKKFNSQPNNLGFAIVGSNGKITMYAQQIDKIPGDVSRNEGETYQSLGGVTIGVPLIFKSPNDIVSFNSTIRSYNVKLEGNNLVFEHVPLNPKPTTVTPITVTQAELSVEDFNKVKAIIAALDPSKRMLRNMFASLTYDKLLSYDPNQRAQYIRWMDDDLKKEDAIKNFINYINNSALINIQIGDRVSRSDSDLSGSTKVSEINGTMLTLEDTTVVDITKESLFKIEDDQTINCPKVINISYGK